MGLEHINLDPDMDVDEARLKAEAIYEANRNAQREAQLDEDANEDAKYHNGLALLKAVKVSKINVDKIFSNREIKQGLLRQLGYRSLRVPKRRGRQGFMPLDECEDERIGLALKHDVESAQRFVQAYEIKYGINVQYQK